MSGDVQPRKRKDKKRKKDELGVEEPRGTAAVLGEGDVFMHSYHEHGTGGHWCAKVIFFSLLAVLITLIGLIILENRGLTELEANSVESRYSGVLEGWLEDAPDDDHHDEHTLELLKQHEDEEDDHDPAHDISLEDDHDEADHDDDDHDEADHEDDDDDDHDEGDQDDDDDNDENESAHDDEDNDDVNNQDNDEDDQEESNEDRKDDDDDDDDDEEEEDGQHLEESNEDNDDDDDEEPANRNNENDEENDDDDLQKVDENGTAEDNDGDDDDDDEDDDDDNLQNQADDRSVENDDDDNDDDRNIDDDENSREDENDDEEHEEHEEEEGDSEIEVEKLEHEVSDNDAASEEQHTQEVEEDDDKSQEDSTEVPPEDSGEADDDGIEDEEFLEADDEPVVERIVVPKGKPLAEVEDEPTTAKPVDTLADEEEYEKQQEQLRREEAQASHVWLKLIVGGALLVATHAVVSRAVAPRDDTPASEGHASREDTPSMIDRRMTLIPEETAPVPASSDIVEEIIRPVIEEKVFGKYSQFVKSEPPPKEESEDEEIEEEEEEVIIDMKEAVAPAVIETEDKELYSDEEEAEEEIVVEKKEAPKQATPVPAKVKDPEPEEEPEEDVPDDVEIIDDEQLEEELEEEEDDEEEISDVDDAELLTRLEAKYGRLPEPERPGPKNKDGGNSIEDDWPGEPADKYWRQQLDEAEQELRQGAWSAAEARASAPELRPSARAMWTKARALDAGADVKRDNRLLTRAITAYLEVLKLNERLSDAKLREIAHRTLDRIRFRGTYLSAEPVYRLLIRRFPEDVEYRNNMTVSFLMADRADLAEEVIKETLQKWPNDRIALAHHGFILKTKHNRLEEAVEAFQKALQGDIGPATEPRFYYHLGDSLLLLSRFAEAQEVHKRGAKLGHFLSPAQRSLYNVERLKSRPWWNIEETPYLKLARALEKSWQDILKEGLAAQALYEKEKEGLKERGEWSQLDLFVRGQEVPGRCKKAPVTCSIVRGEVAAAGCRRGQIKFSSMEAGTHVRPHVGPTNCRLRMHLGLSNTKDTYIRVDQETRQWQVGKVLMFDDSFEHEVWHNGTGTRLVLIVDVWHPALSPAERRDLPPI